MLALRIVRVVPKRSLKPLRKVAAMGERFEANRTFYVIASRLIFVIQAENYDGFSKR
jgi:hypothetical protein